LPGSSLVGTAQNSIDGTRQKPVQKGVVVNAVSGERRAVRIARAVVDISAFPGLSVVAAVVEAARLGRARLRPGAGYRYSVVFRVKGYIGKMVTQIFAYVKPKVPAVFASEQAAGF